MIAKPSAGATLSFPATQAGPEVQTTERPGETPMSPGQPLAFTGDDLERDAIVGAALLAAGWGITRWAASDRTFPR
jgi:hypothetical protein